MSRRTQYKLHTKPDARAIRGPKGHSISISLADRNQTFLDVLDEYAEHWEVSRSEAFFRMVKRYNYADITNKPIQEVTSVIG